jgi:hypothetical protein
MSAPFTAQLRTRGEVITLGAADAPVRWTVRVQVAEAWDAVRVSAPPSESVGAVKAAALRVLCPDAPFHDDFVVKLRGVVVEESATLAEAGAADGSIFLVMFRRRRPVR